MRTFFRAKTWAGPLTIGSFVVVAATGVLMFFHWNVGTVKLAHQWLGWLCIIGVAGHLLVNWKPFLGYFRKPAGVGIMAAMCLVGAMSLLPVGGSSRRPPFMEVQSALERSSLNVVAQVARCSPQAATDKLKSQGIRVHRESQTISEIASENNRRSTEILMCVFGAEKGTTL
jgi:hypothetical protein